MILSFPRPKSWQDFETLTKDVARFKLGGDFENYGRLGQKQNGIDVFGWDNNDKNTAIQCKHLTNESDILKKSVVDDELQQADKFDPSLNIFIIATTSQRDVSLQDHINKINDNRKGKKLPKVILWTWETFDEELNRHAELQYVYYEKVLRAHNHYNKDKHILALIKYSLDRPAFNTEFHAENHCEDFIKAISDTQKAFTTGKLNDREGNPLSSAYPFKNLTVDEDKKAIEEAYSILQDIRDYVTKQFKQGNIIQHQNFLEFRHNWDLKISDYLNKERAKVIALVNQVLRRNKIEQLNSRLVK